MSWIGAGTSWAVARQPVVGRGRKPDEGAGSRQLQATGSPTDVQPFESKRKRAVREMKPSGASEGTSAQPVAPAARASQAKTEARGQGEEPANRKTTMFPASGGAPMVGNSP